MHQKQFYRLMPLLFIGGIVWILAHTGSEFKTLHTNGMIGCPWKYVTGIPCPACGSTRSVLCILQGNFLDALSLNPLGFILLLALGIVPVWLGIDFLRRDSSLYRAFVLLEDYARKPVVFTPLVLLMIMNWIWNITKGL